MKCISARPKVIAVQFEGRLHRSRESGKKYRLLIGPLFPTLFESPINRSQLHQHM